MSKLKVKICGVKEPEHLHAAAGAGAHFIGFVFFPPSPRYIAPPQAAHLIRQLPSTVKAVGLFVDPTDEELDAALGASALDYIQLHGHETPQRVADVKARTLMPIIKALPVSEVADLEQAALYEPHIDWLLFDAKPPRDARVPGGMGQVFDWDLLKDFSFDKPWMLSGGLNPDNVGQAMVQLSPDGIDVSSGVEVARGEKDSQRIVEFLGAVRHNAA